MTMGSSTGTTMSNPTGMIHCRRLISAVWMLALLALMGCARQAPSYDKSIGPQQHIRRRKLADDATSHSPTPTPTRTPIRIYHYVGAYPQYHDEETSGVSNDSVSGADIELEVDSVSEVFLSRIDNDTDSSNGGPATSTIHRRADNTHRLGIIAVSLSALFALLMLAATAVVWWRAYSCRSVPCKKSRQGDDADALSSHSDISKNQTRHFPNNTTTNQAVSILRNRDAEVSCFVSAIHTFCRKSSLLSRLSPPLLYLYCSGRE